MTWRRLPLGARLRDRLGPARRVRRLTSSPRSRVWAAEFGGRRAVVKRILSGEDAYAREVAALTLAARVDPPVVPRLLGRDDARRVLVLEYVDARRPAGDWVVAYAEGLARLHAATTPADAGELPRWQGPGEDDVTAFLTLARTLGVAVPARAPAELRGLVDRLARTSGHALLHGDPCPGNDLHTADGIRFVDFEQASLGDGVTELAYLRIAFPTCWCVTAVPETLLERAEAAYRDTWHAATGTHVQGDLTDACAGWLIRGDALVQRDHRGRADHLARAAEKDWTWGTATARERLAHRLGVVATLTGGRDDLSGLGELSAAMRTRLPGVRTPPRQRP